MAQATNITWHHGTVSPQQRSALTAAKPAVIWLTGLSGSGKSTLAVALEAKLVARGHLAFVLDGDNVRHGLNANLGFSAADRQENIRRIGEVAKLFASAGMLAITSFISPFRADRKKVRDLLPPGGFIEIFVDTPLEICEQRDPKGLYKKARAAHAAGQGLEFTGIDSPYEAPEAPELHLKTAELSVDAAVEKMLHYLYQQELLLTPGGPR